LFDFVAVQKRRIEVVAEPSFQVCVLRVPSGTHGLDEVVVAGDAAAIFGVTGAFSFDARDKG
jgi:hypothetical protein